MGTTLLDLITRLPPELLNGAVLALVIVLINGLSLQLIWFAFRVELLSPGNARYFTLAIFATTVICVLVLIISQVVLYFLGAFGGATVF